MAGKVKEDDKLKNDQLEVAKLKNELQKELMDLQDIKKQILEQQEKFKTEQEQFRYEQEQKQKQEVITKEVKEVTSKRNIDRGKLVEVKNISEGKLCWQSPTTHAVYIFEKYGDTEWVEFGELITLKARFSKILTEPWLLILNDQEVINHLGLKDMYNNMFPIEDVDKFFKKSIDDMKKLLKVMPKGIKELIVIKAFAKVRDETLTDTIKIKFLENELNINLLELIVLQKEKNK